MEQEIASLLTKLEPALGITFALNLAYIGLPRFRYREEIRTHVRTKMDEMQEIPESHCNTVWYKQIVRLGSLGHNDESESKVVENVEFPSEIWAKIYAWIYEGQRDRQSVIVAIFFSVALIFLGVAHEVNIFSFSRKWFSDSAMLWWLLVTTIMCVLPAAAVFFGNYVVKGAKKFVSSNTRDLKKTYQDSARTARIQ